ncbi:MAG: sensor histidine kinase [Hylemonella sp.]|nr:sensor histidine kinase [Hylemonella sp.]
MSTLRLVNESRYSLVGHTAWLEDKEQSLTYKGVTARDAAFQALPKHLSTGFTTAAIWLRFTLDRQAGDPQHWWLEVDHALVEDVQLFEPTADGRWLERRAGSSLPWEQRDLDYRNVVFRLDLAEPGVRTYYLRLASHTAMASRLVLWQPHAFADAAMRESRLNGLFFGVYFFILCFNIVFWRWTRERVHGAYTLYIGINLVTTGLSGGWLPQIVPPLQNPGGTILLGLSVAAGAAAAHHFCVMILQPQTRWPRLTRAYLALGYGLAALAVVLILAGRYQQAMQILQPVTMAMLLVLLVGAVVLACQRSASARLFLVAFTLFYLGVFVRFLRNLGYLEPSAWTDNAYQVGTLMHLLVMSSLILKGYHGLRAAKEAAETQASEERRLREQEHDFMSMVSHEFRTPLSIIKATAHNLSASAGIDDHARERVRKIQRAGLRMAELMDSYLSLERLRSVDQALQVRAYMLDRLCEQVLEELRELPGPALQFVNEAPGALCLCDPELVRLALRNLLQNARRHSPPDRPVSVTLQALATGYAIRVRDQGPGIPADELPLVFKRYFRGRSALAQPGAGLGLHLAQTAAQRHGGSLTVHSIEGAGAEFCLQLPRRPAQTEASAQLGLDPARNVSG